MQAQICNLGKPGLTPGAQYYLGEQGLTPGARYYHYALLFGPLSQPWFT